MNLLKLNFGLREQGTDLCLSLRAEGLLCRYETHGFQECERLEKHDPVIRKRQLAQLKVVELGEAGDGFKVGIIQGLRARECEAA